ncbi:beta-lactamase domain protein [Haloterrigena turkmenica DSM 5511]|uniref:Beta-lactamase domain protein n=1 Tax=Haloterrigena turkmenica (strain ATCC 51198 / DSM 5511 / JCM 9101 / NCIMB 13204 / VKM B-1734 / 4k) TaxID=543526 RepID=D2RWU9_HALTV|nr:ComEC/Rec2 family competence protein [Haloterrigena turkmenica]ADB61600.1 beta-lactamase domain protein [Haloterrigena turkmenica DSM 5511]
MRRHRGLVVVSVAGLLVLSGCLGGFVPSDGSEGASDDSDDAAGDLEIHHIDVGQGDSTLLVTPDGETVLIDTGIWQADGQGVIDYLEGEGIERIDHLVTTHGHADHIGGHAAVIEHFEERGEGVGAVYDPGVASTSATYDNYLDAIEEHEVRLLKVAAGDHLPLEDESVDATVLNPPGDDDGGSIDAYSTVLSVEYGEFSYLTTGDIEDGAERRLVDERGDALAADAYQAGHHGSSTSSTAPFLDAVDPEIAVISSALDSQYGHPHDEVLEAFADRGVETYWTGVHGDIVLETDGEEVAVTPETEGPTDPAALLERKEQAQSESESLSAPSPEQSPSLEQSSPPEQPSSVQSPASLERAPAPVVDSAAPRLSAR